MYFKRLKDLREDHDLSQKKVASLLNTTQQNYCRYETGEREAGYAELIALADYFDVSIDYLLERTENPKMNT